MGAKGSSSSYVPGPLGESYPEYRRRMNRYSLDAASPFSLDELEQAQSTIDRIEGGRDNGSKSE